MTKNLFKFLWVLLVLLLAACGSSAPEPVAVADFQLAAGKPQLVEFYADWWVTCQRLQPVVHGLEKEFGDDVQFVYVNIDDPTSASAKEALGYRFQPHVFLIDENGEIIQQWLGYNSANVYEEAFNELLVN